jgi:hypothetical protein
VAGADDRAVTVARYATRTTAFAVAYLLLLWADSSEIGVFPLLLPPLALAALWMLAMGRWGLRRFDGITLATVTAAGSIAAGADMLPAIGLAAVITAPALLFAILVERWLPGWWQGHGDRFRSRLTRLGRLTGAAALTAVAYLVLQAVLMPGMPLLGLVLTPIQYTVVLLVVALAGRTVNRFRAPRKPGLTLVR